MFFVGVQVGGVGPAYEEIVREGLLSYFFAELFEEIVVFETHDEADWRGGYMMVGRELRDSLRQS